MRKTKVLNADCETGFDKDLHSSIRLNRNININEYPGSEIIELDESSTSEPEDEVRSNEHEHPWCYSNINVHRMDDDNNKINKNAREKWRMKNKIHPGFPSKNAGYTSQESRSVNSNRAYTGSINYVRDHIATKDTQSFNTLNCFTIVKNDIDDSDSSSDKENSIEITECGDVVLERNQLCNDDNSRKIKCNNRLDSTRTILIYSFKNRNIFGGDDNQLFESSPDSTSDSSLENLERVLFDDINVTRNRVPSPAPAPYIPRLDFFAAATLPTVAEVVEPYQLSSENIQLHKDNTSGWFPPDRSSLEGSENKLHEDELLNERQKLVSPIHTHIPSNNIINWMALSPRKRIKVFKVPDLSEEKHVLEKNLISVAQEAKYNTNRDDEIVSTNVPDVKTNNEKNPDVYDETDECNILKEINNQFSMDEKGDRKKIKQLKKPQIRLERMTTNSIISDPIEKLDGEEWIGSENEHIDKPDFDMNASIGSDDLDKPKLTNRCAGDRLFRRNMSLLRPVEWAEYLPITESMPSLHLSLPSDTNDRKRSWFKRFIELFQRCIKCK